MNLTDFLREVDELGRIDGRPAADPDVMRALIEADNRGFVARRRNGKLMVSAHGRRYYRSQTVRKA